MISYMTPQQYAWMAAGKPPCDLEPVEISGHCSTCGGEDTYGITTDAINNPTFSQHGDFFRYGTHVCRACAWLYRMGKSRPGNMVAAGEKLYWPTIAANPGRDQWISVLEEIANLPDDSQIAGILTTDVKPRLFPRMRLGTKATFGMVVHAPEYDVSGWLPLQLDKLLEIAHGVAPMLNHGYSKRSLLLGILRDYPRAIKHMDQALQWEQQLATWRQQAEFVPALVVATARGELIDGTTSATEQSATTSRKATKGQPGLFQ